MNRLFVGLVSVACLVSFMVDISYGERYVICYRHGKGRCLKCQETVMSGAPNHYDHHTLCHGVGKTFDSLDEAERWRARNCTCPGSK